MTTDNITTLLPKEHKLYGSSIQMSQTSTLQPTVFATVFPRRQQTANNFKKQTLNNPAEGRIGDPRAAYKRQSNFVNCAVEDKQCCESGTKRQTFVCVRH